MKNRIDFHQEPDGLAELERLVYDLERSCEEYEHGRRVTPEDCELALQEFERHESQDDQA